MLAAMLNTQPPHAILMASCQENAVARIFVNDLSK